MSPRSEEEKDEILRRAVAPIKEHVYNPPSDTAPEAIWQRDVAKSLRLLLGIVAVAVEDEIDP